MPEVRLIDERGEQHGVLKIEDALRFASERDLDLVEVAPEAKPPVVRVLDYSKYKYEQAQKLKQARKHQQQITIREIKFRPKIAQHDYATKKGHVERFLRHKDKVKVTLMFRGREVTHPERGLQLLDRLAEELAEYSVVEQRPLHDGRNMTMMLGPSKAVLAGQYDKGAVEGAENGAAPDADAAILATESAASGNGAAPPEPATATPAPAEEPAPAAEVEVRPSVPEPEPEVEVPPPSDPEPEPEPETPSDPAPEPEVQTPPSDPEPADDVPAAKAPKKAPARATAAKAKAASPKPAAKPRGTAAKAKPSSSS